MSLDKKLASLLGIKNPELTSDEIAKIRRIRDFDLVMLIGEIDENGWDVARKTLAMMPEEN